MIPFAGPSYQLETRKASQQRSVNLFLAGMETQSKAAFILQSAPGLDLATAGVGVTRGVLPVGGRLFGVFGSGLYEIGSTGALTLLGSLASSTGECSMEYGLTQLVVVDGTRTTPTDAESFSDYIAILRDLGKDLSQVAQWVCIEGMSANECAVKMRHDARGGITLLRITLDALGDYFGMPRS